MSMIVRHPFIGRSQEAATRIQFHRCGARTFWLVLLIVMNSMIDSLAQTTPLRRPAPQKSVPASPASQLASNLARGTNQLVSALTNLFGALDWGRFQLMTQQIAMRFCVEEVTNLNRAEKEVAAYLNDSLASYYDRNRSIVGFGPTLSFDQARAEIRTNEIFKFLRRMPKGALLHAHLSAVGRMDWVISNAVTLPNCYVKWPADPKNSDRGELRLSATRPGNDFFLVSEMVERHKADPNRPPFTNALRDALSVDVSDMDNRERIFPKFGRLFGRTGGFAMHDSMVTNYLVDAFQTLWDDGIYYVELRDSIGDWKPENSAGVERRVQQILAARSIMQAKHRDFDCRIIVAGNRADPTNVINKYNQTRQLKMQHPDLIVGFDLIGEESGDGLAIGKTNRNTLIKFRDVAARMASDPQFKDFMNPLGMGLSYYLHDGESAWADNENLMDAVLLKAPRIGHAFNLFRFPSLIPLIKSNDIALEICPISNQLLGLTPDLRTHPAAGYLNAGIQCTLSSDDPLYFGNDGLSYDFWVASVAWKLDLAALKRLARNSITYCALGDTDKLPLTKHWETEWNRFITSEAIKIRTGTPPRATPPK